MTMRVGDALAAAAARLREAGVESARREARYLLAHVMGRPGEWLVAHPEAAVAEASAFEQRLQRRVAREPLSHIVGQREFWSLPFAVNADVLDPRADSEALVEAALERMPDRDAEYQILDLGTGSGCLLLALLSERPRAQGLGVDSSPAALAVAARNARSLGFADRASFVPGDWTNGLTGAFDIIVSNPPYIPSASIEGLAPEVARYEPRAALDGGPDGLQAYRDLAAQLAGRLAANGRVLVEIGAGQSADVCGIFAAFGWVCDASVSDLSGIPRCMVFGAGARAG